MGEKIIILILSIGLVHGLLFVFLVPPWEHYDEPAHFEYAWLIANRQKLPSTSDYDQGMRLAVGQSLLNSGFFKRRGSTPPNVTDPTQPLWIGLSQLSDPPLYYIIVAIPLFLLQHSPIEVQLYLGRLVSLSLFLLTIWVAWKLISELTPDKHPLRWAVPLFMALLPGYVELMTAINNHAAGISFFSIWLLISVKLINHGFSWKRFVYIIIFTGICLFTQKSVWITLVFLPIVLALSLLYKHKQSIVWIACLLCGLLGILIVFEWRDAALWLGQNYQNIPSRTQSSNDEFLHHALQAQVYPDQTWGVNDPNWHSGFFQLVPEKDAKSLFGKTVTIGWWIWANKKINAYGPGLNSFYQSTNRWYGFKPVEAGQTPVFVASVVTIPPEESRIQLWLRVTSPDNEDAIINYSGVILVEGEWPTDTVPQFLDKNGVKGVWGGRSFINLARNSMFLNSWPNIRPWLYRLLEKMFTGLNPTHISSVIALLLDWKGTEWYIKFASETIFRTFWAKFCWGQVPLIGIFPYFYRPYFVLLIISFLGLIGSIMTGIISYKYIKWNSSILLLTVCAGIAAFAFFYGVYTMGGGLLFRTYAPVARYIFPAILPISIFLVNGWHEIFVWIKRFTKIPSITGGILYAIFLVALDVYSLTSLVLYFQNWKT